MDFDAAINTVIGSTEMGTVGLMRISTNRQNAPQATDWSPGDMQGFTLAPPMGTNFRYGVDGIIGSGRPWFSPGNDSVL